MDSAYTPELQGAHIVLEKGPHCLAYSELQGGHIVLEKGPLLAYSYGYMYTAIGIMADTLHPTGHAYTLHITTGDRPGAGTNANVYVTLHGEGGRGDSGRVWLEGRGRTLCTGQTDSFPILSPLMVSPVDMITVGHDNSGVGPGWFLETLVVECGTTGECREFPCHRWLCADEEDGRIERELHPTVAGDVGEEGRVWMVSVWTSDIRGAGTDANVTIQVRLYVLIMYQENLYVC